MYSLAHSQTLEAQSNINIGGKCLTRSPYRISFGYFDAPFSSPLKSFPTVISPLFDLIPLLSNEVV
jgi:hypothetical protein